MSCSTEQANIALRQQCCWFQLDASNRGAYFLQSQDSSNLQFASHAQPHMYVSCCRNCFIRRCWRSSKYRFSKPPASLSYRMCLGGLPHLCIKSCEVDLACLFSITTALLTSRSITKASTTHLSSLLSTPQCSPLHSSLCCPLWQRPFPQALLSELSNALRYPR